MSIPTRTRRIALVLVVAVALVALARVGYVRFLGESATYPACVAAMDGVAVGQSLAEAEALIDQAVASGAERWTPGAEMLADARVTEQYGLAAGSAWVNCVRYEPNLALAPDPGPNPLANVVTSTRMWVQIVANEAFNYTEYHLVLDGERVTMADAYDCNSWPVDTHDCRPHGEPPRVSP